MNPQLQEIYGTVVKTILCQILKNNQQKLKIKINYYFLYKKIKHVSLILVLSEITLNFNI